MKVSVDTTGRSGRLTKHVTVYSNDRTTPAFTMTVTLDVAPR